MAAWSASSAAPPSAAPAATELAAPASIAEETRLPDGALMAQRDAPVGGQAVLEGVMMRGVSTWAVAVRKPLPEQLGEDGLDPEEAALGEIEVDSFPLVSWTQAPPRLPLADHPRRRRARPSR